MTTLPERGTRVMIRPGARVGFVRTVMRAPSFGWRALVLSTFGDSTLLVVVVERHGRALVELSSVTPDWRASP